MSIQVGGTQFGAGTAELPSGSFDTASLNVGFGAPGAVTISGAGTELNMDQTSGGGAVSVGSGFSFGPGGSALGSLKVIEGATIDGGFLIDVGGFSSLNPGVLEVSGAGSGIQLTCGTGCKRLGNSISGRVLDPASGLAGVNVHPGGHVSVANGGQIVINTGIGTDNLPGFLVDGTLRVDGAGSRIALIGDGDGPLFTTVGGGNFAIGGKTLNPASVEVTNGAQIVLQGTNTVAGIAPGPTLFSPGAAGRLLVEGGGSLFDAGSLLFVGAKSDLSGPGGVGELKVATGGRVKADLIFIGTNGTVTGGGGTLEGMVEVHGMLAPGSSPGTMNIEGDLNLTSDGHVLIEIAGNTPGLQYDVLNVSGAANLDGTLEIVLLDGFTPGDTDTFDFINALSFIGSFDNLILPTFGSGKTFALNFGPAGITAAVSAVPVPAALPLLASALLFGGVAARRTRHCHGTRCELSL